MSTEPEQPNFESQPAQPEPIRPNRRVYIVPVVIGVAFVAVTFTRVAIRLEQEKQPAVVAANSYNFQPGQCFDRQETTSAVPSTSRDCALPHSAEVYSVVPLAGATYPGQSTVEAFGRRKCVAEVVTALTPDTNYSGVTTSFLYPSDQKQWDAGDRSIKCFFRRDDTLPITGHVKDTGLPYTPEQKRYRDVVAPYDAVVGEQDPTVGWTAEKDVVARSVLVVQQEIDALKAGPWPAEVQGTITKLIAAKQVELADRQHAAADADEAGFTHDLNAATSDSGATQDLTVRVTLGLSPR